MTGKVYKKIEIVGTSDQGIEQAVANAVAKSGESVRNISWFEVTETRGAIKEDDTIEWQVTVKFGFHIE